MTGLTSKGMRCAIVFHSQQHDRTMNKFDKNGKNHARYPRPVAGKRQKTRYSKWGYEEPGGCACLLAILVVMAAIGVLLWLWLGLR